MNGSPPKPNRFPSNKGKQNPAGNQTRRAIKRKSGMDRKGKLMITKREYDALKTKATKKLTDKEKRDMALYKDYTETLAKVIAHKTALAKLIDCRANDYKGNYTKPYTNKADKTALARKDGYTVMVKGKKIASGNHYPNMTKRATAEKGTLIYKIK